MNRTVTKPYLEEVDVVNVGISNWLKKLLFKLGLLKNFTVQETNGVTTLGKTYTINDRLRISVPFWMKNPTEDQYTIEFDRIRRTVRELSYAQGKYVQQYNIYEEVIRWKGDSYWAIFAVPKMNSISN